MKIPLLLLALSLPLLTLTQDPKCTDEQHIETSPSGQKFCATNTKGCTNFDPSTGNCTQCGNLYFQTTVTQNGAQVLECDEILYVWIPGLIVICTITMVLVWQVVFKFRCKCQGLEEEIAKCNKLIEENREFKGGLIFELERYNSDNNQENGGDKKISDGENDLKVRKTDIQENNL